MSVSGPRKCGCPGYVFKVFWRPLAGLGRFLGPLKIRGAPKTVQTNSIRRLFGAPGRRKGDKQIVWKVFGKNIKNNENSMRKLEVFYGLEPRLALYSSLITHFRHFSTNIEKLTKKGPNNDAKIDAKFITKRFWAAQGAPSVDLEYFFGRF